MEKTELKNLHSVLIDALERLYLGVRGQPRIDALRDAIEAYEDLIAYWAEQKKARTPDFHTYIYKDGRKFRLQCIRGTLATYVPDREHFPLYISSPADPYACIMEREIEGGYGILLDKMDLLRSKGLTPTPKNAD